MKQIRLPLYLTAELISAPVAKLGLDYASLIIACLLTSRTEGGSGLIRTDATRDTRPGLHQSHMASMPELLFSNLMP